MAVKPYEAKRPVNAPVFEADFIEASLETRGERRNLFTMMFGRSPGPPVAGVTTPVVIEQVVEIMPHYSPAFLQFMANFAAAVGIFPRNADGSVMTPPRNIQPPPRMAPAPPKDPRKPN